uniref:Glutathione synthetase n=1 Tax=Schistosoma japonicum TaxID=6182 RepID=C1L3Q0_SCHJA|nr:glutathione synthetase [Schistosoma japonicum]
MQKLVSEFAVSNGILKVVDGKPSLLSCTLLPSPVPKTLLHHAKNIQCDFNLLYHRVAMDHEFLDAILKPVVVVDPYLRSLWNIYSRIRTNQVTQDIVLGLNRSDYMLHLQEDLCNAKRQMLIHRLQSTKLAAQSDIETEDEAWNGLSIKQVEFNMIACSFCGLGQRIAPQHRIALSLHGISKDLNTRVPDCFSADRFSDALLSACRMYVEDCSRRSLVPTKVSILIVVGDNEGNIYDHRALIGCLLLKSPEVNVLYHSFNYLKTGLKLDSNFRLFVDNQEIAVVYFRTGYTPDAFPDEETWNVKYQLEQSLAIKCPCIQYMLANTKIIQAALSKPKYLSRFFQPDSASYVNILSTFVHQYTLDEEMEISDATEIQYAVNDCLLRPDDYVLKPQREGGGNNYFGEELAQKLKSIITHSERKFYILMKRIQPYTFENYILNSSSMFEESKARKMVTEMGIFGAILARKNHIFLNECSGHLLRSKPLESNEGGIVAGFGCLDSPFLV